MGLFRLVLAFCVVLAHGLNLPIPAARADVAVQTFYIVSGFYMALVLTEKYRDFSTYFFNRLLRIYPAYFLVALATVGHSVLRILTGRVAGDPGLIAYESHFAPPTQYEAGPAVCVSWSHRLCVPVVVVARPVDHASVFLRILLLGAPTRLRADA